MIMEIIILVILIIAIGFVFQRLFPSKKKILSMDTETIGAIMNGYWILTSLFISPLLIYLFYNIFRQIQFYAIGINGYNGFDVIVLSFFPFIIPVGFAAFCIGNVVFFNLFFNEKFILEKLAGLDDSEKRKYYNAIMGYDQKMPIVVSSSRLGFIPIPLGFLKLPHNGNKLDLFMFIFGIIFLIPATLSSDYNIKVRENGIYKNSWFSIGKEVFYSWQDIKSINLEKGVILKSNVYEKNKISSYSIGFSDGSSWFLNDNFKPMKYTMDEIADYIADKSGRKITCNIADVSKSSKGSIDCNMEPEIIKKYPVRMRGE